MRHSLYGCLRSGAAEVSTSCVSATERNHGRHQVSTVVTKQPLIIDTTTASMTAAIAMETSGCSQGISKTKKNHKQKQVGNMSSVSPGDEQEAGEAGGGGASEMWWQQARCRCLRGGGRCYWSFLSDSDESSLDAASSGETSSYLEDKYTRTRVQGG